MKRKLAALSAMLGLFYVVAAYAGVEDAKAAYDKGDYATALQEARPLAEQGNAAAQNLLGNLYSSGKGVPQDYAQALDWYRKAAEQGYAYGQVGLGFMYDKGQGVPQNYAQAAAWYRKAAEQGNAYAQNNLGGAYYFGHGVTQDYAQAAAWYRKAAEQGNADAQTNLGVAYYNGQGVSQDYAQAAAWYRKAAEQGNKQAQQNLSLLEPKLKKEQAAKEDEARGYHLISFTDFQLDAKSMRAGKRLSIKGYYEVAGHRQTLAEAPSQAQIPNAYELFLLTEDAPRDTRKKLLQLQNCGQYMICEIIVLGHIQKCSETFLGKKVRDTVCIAVDDIRAGS